MLKKLQASALFMLIGCWLISQGWSAYVSADFFASLCRWISLAIAARCCRECSPDRYTFRCFTSIQHCFFFCRRFAATPRHSILLFISARQRRQIRGQTRASDTSSTPRCLRNAGRGASVLRSARADIRESFRHAMQFRASKGHATLLHTYDSPTFRYRPSPGQPVDSLPPCQPRAQRRRRRFFRRRFATQRRQRTRAGA